MASNKFGVDKGYFEHRMKLIIKNLDDYTPQELYRELTRLADVAVPNGGISREAIEKRISAALGE